MTAAPLGKRPPPKARDSRLTGKIRHDLRTPIFRRPMLVLMVEVEAGYSDHRDPNEPRNGEVFTHWRDASPQDLADLATMSVERPLIT